jgi:hypothetical protein
VTIEIHSDRDVRGVKKNKADQNLARRDDLSLEEAVEAGIVRFIHLLRRSHRCFGSPRTKIEHELMPSRRDRKNPMAGKQLEALPSLTEYFLGDTVINSAGRANGLGSR